MAAEFTNPPTEIIITEALDKIIDEELSKKPEEQEVVQKMSHLNVDTHTEQPSAVPADEALEPFDYNAIAVNMVQFQVEYHFSDENLALDNFLLSKLNEDKEHWVPIKVVASLNKIKSITEDMKVILDAIRKSEILVLNQDETKVKRKDFVPPKPKHHKNMRRTVFIYGLSANATQATIMELCCDVGKVKAIVFDDGSSHIVDKETVKEADLEFIDRDVAVQIMTKKFGPRAIRSNSSSFADTLSQSEKFAFLSMEQQRVSAELSSPTDATPKTSINSPVFVHPIANPNGDPLDFSHLRTCFVIFQSQSQANNFVKSRAKSNDGIKALHQYEYIKYQKRASMAQARGISPLISPNSIGLAVNSPTYSIIGSTKNSNNSNNSNRTTGPYSPQNVSPAYGQHDFHHNQAPHMVSPAHLPQAAMTQPVSAMDYYLTNYQSGSMTPMVMVPAEIADAMVQEFQKKLHSKQRRNTHGRNNYHQQAQHYHRQHPNGRHTWSHAQQKRSSSNGYHSGHFDFNAQNSKYQHPGHKFANRNSQNGNSRHSHSGAKTTKHRNMRKSWRNSADRFQTKGTVPPEPSPAYNYVQSNKAGSIAVESNAKYVRKTKVAATHVSPAITPNVATIQQR